ncbi:MAG: NAD(P)-dependent oxidoreductase [Elusimicrobia bacterium]|nr:NAD(P)-dependent oxidoreductase [Elusimicrobiota bacterium]
MTNEIKGRRILLLGGAGFIGHNLALSLKSQGADVHVVDGLQVNNLLYYSSRDHEGPNRDLYVGFINERLRLLQDAGVPLWVEDLRDYHALARTFEKIKPQTVVHLAAVAHAGKSNKDPFSTFDHSLRTLENALDCSRGRIEHFVYFSSSMVYGNFRTPEVTEDHPLDSIGIYGALKVAGEKMVTAYHQVFNLPYTIVRPSALYGERCVSRRVGQVFIESALAGTPLRVDGDGSERLDFTYIGDLVRGVELAMVKDAARNETFNITHGQSRSVQELIEVVRSEFPNIKVERVERDKLMPFRGTLDVEKARRLLGYAPAYPIEKGFRDYIAWYKNRSKVPAPNVV